MFADNISAVIECHQLLSAGRIQSALDKTPVVGLLRNAWTKPTKQNTTHAITACTSLLSLDRCRANNQIWLIVSLHDRHLNMRLKCSTMLKYRARHYKCENCLRSIISKRQESSIDKIDDELNKLPWKYFVWEYKYAHSFHDNPN